MDIGLAVELFKKEIAAAEWNIFLQIGKYFCVILLALIAANVYFAVKNTDPSGNFSVSGIFAKIGLAILSLVIYFFIGLFIMIL